KILSSDSNIKTTKTGMKIRKTSFPFFYCYWYKNQTSVRPNQIKTYARFSFELQNKIIKYFVKSNKYLTFAL
ncbi:MAG: hypothetical protein U0K90_08955, partial [Bacteroidales bacterium]|nr:hypothetical protein [Bacteroidales bacterium]